MPWVSLDELRPDLFGPVRHVNLYVRAAQKVHGRRIEVSAAVLVEQAFGDPPQAVAPLDGVVDGRRRLRRVDGSRDGRWDGRALGEDGRSVDGWATMPVFSAA